MRTIVLTPALLAPIGWACAVLWIDGPASRPLAGLLAGGFAFSAGAVLLSVRPFARALAAFAALFGLVLFWWLRIEPSNEREWSWLGVIWCAARCSRINLGACWYVILPSSSSFVLSTALNKR